MESEREHTGNRMDTKNFAIGILSTTAVILVVGLVLLHTGREQAWASGMTAAGGEYVLTVGLGVQRDEELVYVIHAPTQRMVTYRFDTTRQQIEIVQGMDLAELRQPAAEPAQPKGRKSGSGGRRRP